MTLLRGSGKSPRILQKWSSYPHIRRNHTSTLGETVNCRTPRFSRSTGTSSWLSHIDFREAHQLVGGERSTTTGSGSQDFLKAVRQAKQTEFCYFHEARVSPNEHRLRILATGDNIIAPH